NDRFLTLLEEHSELEMLANDSCQNSYCQRTSFGFPSAVSSFLMISLGVEARFSSSAAPIVTGGFTIRRYQVGDDMAWDDFVRQHLHASPFHLMAWKRTIEESFGYRPLYLLADQGGQIRGILPLFLISNLIV